VTQSVSDEAVRRATGRGWADWHAALDELGAAGWDHKQLVAHLEAEVESGWWRQSIAVRYEQDRGGRVVGQTRDAGFQVGVRRTVDAPAPQVWDLLISRTDLWLGAGPLRLDKGADYELTAPDGPVRGQVRVVRPPDRVRLTWHPAGWTAPATLQLTLLAAASGRTTVGVHVEKLADAPARERARAHWREVLDRLAAALEAGS
jgi:uncharacterized protein YndB with AHSA1/START domain